METLIRWLTGELGTAGEYQYTAIHLWSTAAVAAAVAAAAYAGSSKLSDRGKKRLLAAICVFQLGFEVLWRLVYLFIKKDSLLCWWPLYPCNLGGILLPLFALTNCRRGKQMFYLFGFVGGCLTFALPEGIFCKDVLVFPILKSILQHTGLLLIPALEFTWGRFRPRLRDMGWVILGLLVHLCNSEGLVRLLGFTGDYLFFRSGMPFVLPGVPQYITLSVFALAVLTLLSALCQIRFKKSAA